MRVRILHMYMLPYISIVEQLPEPLLVAFPFTRDRGCISYVVLETKQLGLPRRQRTTSRLVGASVVMDSRLVTRVENMATMSNLEVLEVDLNGTTSNSLRKFLLVFLPFIKFLVWLSLFLVWLCRLLTRLCSKIVIHVVVDSRSTNHTGS
mgnify:CR=1 FL=1